MCTSCPKGELCAFFIEFSFITSCIFMKFDKETTMQETKVILPIASVNKID